MLPESAFVSSIHEASTVQVDHGVLRRLVPQQVQARVMKLRRLHGCINSATGRSCCFVRVAGTSTMQVINK